MVRLRFLYLLSITIALAIVAPAWEGYNNAPRRSGTVLAAQSIAQFKTYDGLPDPNEIFRLVNKERLDSGLQPLEKNVVLTHLAEQRAQDMSLNNYYAHKNLAGKLFYNVLADDGYKVDYGCENLDLDFTTEPSTYVSSWMKSTAGHRECLLNATVTQAGYAVAPIANYSTQDRPSYVIVAIHATQPLTAK